VGRRPRRMGGAGASRRSWWPFRRPTMRALRCASPARAPLDLVAPCVVPAAPAPVARQPPQRRNRVVLPVATRRFVYRHTSKRATPAMEKATLAASPLPPPAKPYRKVARTPQTPSTAALANRICQEDMLLESFRETKPANIVNILARRREMTARKESEAKQSG